MVVHSAKLAGAQLVALGQAEALAQDHDLVIAIGPGPLRSRFEPFGDLVGAPTRLPIWGASRCRWALELARAIPDAIRLATIVRRRGVAVIVAGSTVLVAPVLAGRLARVPVLVCAHEAPTSRAACRIFRFHATWAHTVIAISPWIAEAFRPSRSRLIISPPGIPIPDWRDPARQTSTARTRLLVAGTIDAHKRQDVAISALARLRESGVDAELDIVGREGDERYAGDVRRLVAELELTAHVRFLGESSGVLDHMRGVDALLVPAGEVTPLVLMEAMAVGTPVVAARMGSIPDVVLDGQCGLLVKPGDCGEMAAAVRRLLDEPQLGAALARAGRARVEACFDERRSHSTLLAELSRLHGRARAVRT